MLSPAAVSQSGEPGHPKRLGLTASALTPVAPSPGGWPTSLLLLLELLVCLFTLLGLARQSKWLVIV